MEHLTQQFDQVYRPVSESEAPALHRVIDELCAKAGMEKPTVCFAQHEAVASHLERFTLQHGAFALWVDKPRMIFGEKLREAFGHQTAASEVSEELKAVIAHELSHIHHGDAKFLRMVTLNNAPIYGAIAAAGGTFLYEHLKHREAIKRSAGMSGEQAHVEMHKEWETSDQVSHPAVQPLQPILTAAKMAAGGLLGFVAGALVFRFSRHHMEFRADKFSAELMGDGQPLIRALRVIQGQGQAAINPEAYAHQKPYARFLSQHTHPTDEARVQRLEKFVPER